MRIVNLVWRVGGDAPPVVLILQYQELHAFCSACRSGIVRVPSILIVLIASVLALAVGCAAPDVAQQSTAIAREDVAATAAAPTATGAKTPRARLEPARGTYFGVNLDWDQDSVAEFNARLGAPAAVYVEFTRFPLSEQDVTVLDGFIEQVKAQHGLALITLEPYIALDDINLANTAGLVDVLQRYDSSGVPVFLRFAQEMNGSWYRWSQQPSSYVRAFRLLADEVHRRTKQTAMLWAPNYGGGYPFRGGKYEAKPGTKDFTLLDTNGDGILDQNDDTYAPYYPGDDAVDWVGMTIYHWGDRWPWGKNVVPEANKFTAQITGTYNGAAGDEQPVPDFYAIYAEERGKPMAVPETSAFYNTTVSGDAEQDIKRLWWRQVFSAEVAERFPAIKMVNWFEWRKAESEVGGAVVDWTFTSNPDTVRLFLDDLPKGRFLFAGDIVGNGPATTR